MVIQKLPPPDTTKRIRDTNLELYRIICMFFIVAHHYVVNSGLIEILNCEPLSIKCLSFYWLGMWGKTGINCFVLITGYYMCTSKITIKKTLKLVFEIEFYMIIIFIIFKITNYGDLKWNDLIVTQLNSLAVSDNFAQCFVYFYLFIPFLNILIQNLNKRQHTNIIILCLFIYTVLGTMFKIEVKMNYVEWFCVLYLISSYIRKHGLPWGFSTMQWGGLVFMFVLLSMCSVYVMASVLDGKEKAVYYFVSDANHIMAVLVSLALFMYFKTMTLPYNKLINTIAQSVFGVLLIHANCSTMRHWLWYDTVDVIGQYYHTYAMACAVSTIIIVFVVCIIIDLLRIRLLERPLFSYLENRWELR